MAAADRLHEEDEARLRQQVAVAAAAPAELVVGGVLEGRGGSVELVCARTRLLALSLELELAHLDAGGGSRRFSACFRSFATRMRKVDTNKDGVVSFEEHVQAMMKAMMTTDGD